MRLVDQKIGELNAEDYRSMDSPTVVRKGRQATQPYGEQAKSQDMDYLDIPAFLRRQAD